MNCAENNRARLQHPGTQGLLRVLFPLPFVSVSALKDLPLQRGLSVRLFTSDGGSGGVILVNRVGRRSVSWASVFLFDPFGGRRFMDPPSNLPVRTLYDLVSNYSGTVGIYFSIGFEFYVYLKRCFFGVLAEEKYLGKKYPKAASLPASYLIFRNMRWGMAERGSCACGDPG